MDIGIYTREEVLEHKKNDGLKEDGNYCYWKFDTVSKKVKIDDKIFFASKGKWQGYFVIHGIDYTHDELRFYSESWQELKEKPERKPFQGFTYKVPEA